MGTQVVAEMAADFPEQVDHIVLIAPVVAPSARSIPKLAGLLLTMSSPYALGWWVALCALAVPAWLAYCLVRG